jgi:hypothetical protein
MDQGHYGDAARLPDGGSAGSDTAALVARARSGSYPPNWYVWSLQRDKVLRGALTWVIYALGGFILLVPALFIMIPDNFTGDSTKAAFSLIILFLLGTMAFGSVFYLINDLRRWKNAGAYLLLMTPDDFVKVEPRRTIHVPMDNIAYVTLKGVRNVGSAYVQQQSVATTVLLHRPPRTVSPSPFRAPLLTFRDTRTNKVVTISQDEQFDDLRALDELLNTFVEEKVRARKAAAEAAAQEEHR